MLMLFAFVWVVLGNYWVFSSKTCKESSKDQVPNPKGLMYSVYDAAYIVVLVSDWMLFFQALDLCLRWCRQRRRVRAVVFVFAPSCEAHFSCVLPGAHMLVRCCLSAAWGARRAASRACWARCRLQQSCLYTLWLGALVGCGPRRGSWWRRRRRRQRWWCCKCKTRLPQCVAEHCWRHYFMNTAAITQD